MDANFVAVERSSRRGKPAELASLLQLPYVLLRVYTGVRVIMIVIMNLRDLRTLESSDLFDCARPVTISCYRRAGPCSDSRLDGVETDVMILHPIPYDNMV